MVGFAAGIPRVALNLALLKGAKIVGVFWGAAIDGDPPGTLDAARQLLQWLSEGVLAPPAPTTYPLDRGGEAIAALADRTAVGKLVVQVSPG